MQILILNTDEHLHNIVGGKTGIPEMIILMIYAYDYFKILKIFFMAKKYRS